MTKKSNALKKFSQTHISAVCAGSIRSTSQCVLFLCKKGSAVPFFFETSAVVQSFFKLLQGKFFPKIFSFCFFWLCCRQMQTNPKKASLLFLQFGVDFGFATYQIEC